jgi:glycerol-3-phosphate dehydrogenase
MHSSERATLAVILAAVEAGAMAANYVEATGFLRDGARVVGVRVRDTAAMEGRNGDAGRTLDEFELRARVVANMTGPWAPQVNDRLDRRPRGRFRLSKGVHLVTRPLTRSGALALATRHQSDALLSRGGRHFFIIPWRGHSLIGTTNVPYSGDPAEVGVTEKDIADFLAEIASAYPAAAVRREDVRFFFGGLYPLVDKDVRAGVYQGAGKYEIHDHAREGIEGLITVIGAKYTTARNLARQAIDEVFRKLSRVPPASRTASTPVHGGRIERFDDFLDQAVLKDSSRGFGLGADVMRELVLCYGSEYSAVLKPLEEDPSWGRRVAEDRPIIGAMVYHAVRHEMALHLTDVVFRRTGLGTIGNPGGECLSACAAIMAKELRWDGQRVEREMAAASAVFRTRG